MRAKAGYCRPVEGSSTRHRQPSRDEVRKVKNAIRGDPATINFNSRSFQTSLLVGLARLGGNAFRPEGDAADTMASSLLIARQGEWWRAAHSGVKARSLL